MTIIDDLRGIATSVRAIPNDFGLRPYRVFVHTKLGADGHFTGGEQYTEQEITEANSAPPKVRWLTDEELAVGGYDGGRIRVGPITPECTAGGTPIACLKPSIDGKLSNEELVYFRICGPEFPAPLGARFRLDRLESDRGIHLTLILRRTSD